MIAIDWLKKFAVDSNDTITWEAVMYKHASNDDNQHCSET